jgi:RNA polymerase sigma-70 factor, ECF subfamily
LVTELREPQTLRHVDSETFDQLVEQHRAELRVHCYRVTGSLHEAEDLTQETMLRAWKSRDSFEGRSSLRTWLYKIATNLCLDALKHQSRRRLVEDYGPAGDPTVPAAPPITEQIWLDPFPDRLLDLVDHGTPGPEERYTLLESVDLAFVAAVQFLPPKQRAVLLLRDVLGFSAEETAQQLDTTVISVNSALVRARRTLSRRLSPGTRDSAIAAATGRQRAVVEKYVRAWEAADIEELSSLLREDVFLGMPPMPSWYSGRASVLEFLARNPLSPEWQPRLKLVPTRANGRAAFGVYHREGEADIFTPFGIMTLRIEGDAIAEIGGFLDPSLFPFFALPERL